jgi:hypothetical protein
MGEVRDLLLLMIVRLSHHEQAWLSFNGLGGGDGNFGGGSPRQLLQQPTSRLMSGRCLFAPSFASRLLHHPSRVFEDTCYLEMQLCYVFLLYKMFF